MCIRDRYSCWDNDSVTSGIICIGYDLECAVSDVGGATVSADGATYIKKLGCRYCMYNAKTFEYG